MFKYLLLLSLLPLYCWGDDTAGINSMLATGNTTLTSGHTYSVSGMLTAPHNFNLNNSTIIFSGTGVKINITASITVSGGTCIGSSDNTSSNQTCIQVNNVSGVTISNLTIRQFGQYAVTCTNANGIHITNNLISDIGFLCISEITNSGVNSGITITGNNLDRSMNPAPTIPQPALITRNFAPGTQKGITVSGNTIIVVHNPTANAAECYEISGVTNSSIHNNTFTGGTIGLSNVGASNNTQAYNNTYTGQRDYGIECGGSINCNFHNETISSGRIGAIFDGGYLTTADTLSNSTISGLTSFPIQLITSLTSGIVVNNLTVNTTTNAILVQNGAAGLTINGGTYTGNSTTYAIFSSNSPGQIYLNSVTFTGFTPKLIIAGSTSPGLIYNNVVGNLVVLTPGTLGVTAGSNTVLGANIVFSNNHPPNISYSPSSETWTQYVAISPYSPTNSGGAATLWAVSPVQPIGVSFSTSTGIFSGIPTVPTSTASYNVSATNNYGVSHFSVSLTVNANGGGGGVIAIKGLKIAIK